MRWIVDRFEGDTAVVETPDGSFPVPRAALPAGTREGDVLSVRRDRIATRRRRREAERRLNRLARR